MPVRGRVTGVQLKQIGPEAQIEFGHRQEGEIVHLFLGIKALEGTDVAFCHVRLLISP